MLFFLYLLNYVREFLFFKLRKISYVKIFGIIILFCFFICLLFLRMLFFYIYTKMKELVLIFLNVNYQLNPKVMLKA